MYGLTFKSKAERMAFNARMFRARCADKGECWQCRSPVDPDVNPLCSSCRAKNADAARIRNQRKKMKPKR